MSIWIRILEFSELVDYVVDLPVYFNISCACSDLGSLLMEPHFCPRGESANFEPTETGLISLNYEFVRG